ncbi:2-hydroxychromene-2-carboxylate isomerase [uncultured Roseobacter sp.]|uniref:2-hydroxychromene-2-carboxylate isomerase n=1 Tax=uncultured Roseobacter sp. TaxID=114847 RepID=UPI00260EF473|nr:2-hydroxychromene-2-carboxylate isomerase [uncultured Roseobacter sp.]
MKTIDYFYSCHSVFAYFGAWRLEEIAAEKQARIIHRPFDLDPVMQAAGSTPFRERSTAHRAYFFGREIARWAEYRNLAITGRRPTYHDNPLAPGNGIIIAAQNAGGDAGALSRAILQAHWKDDADMADPDTLTALAEGLGMNGRDLMAAAMSDAVQAEHAENTRAAIAAGVFGSPTYFVDGDMFYGQDRLELVARALDTPFAR